MSLVLDVYFNETFLKTNITSEGNITFGPVQQMIANVFFGIGTGTTQNPFSITIICSFGDIGVFAELYRSDRPDSSQWRFCMDACQIYNLGKKVD